MIEHYELSNKFSFSSKLLIRWSTTFCADGGFVMLFEDLDSFDVGTSAAAAAAAASLDGCLASLTGLLPAL